MKKLVILLIFLLGASLTYGSGFSGGGGGSSSISVPNTTIPENYSGVGDAKYFGNGHIVSTSSNFTTTENVFASTDVGKAIVIFGAGAASADLTTTISAYSSPTSITLTVAASTTTATSITMTTVSAALQAGPGLSPSTTYYYKVAAMNKYGRTLPSAEVSVTTPSSCGNCQTHLTWTPVTGAAYYVIYGSKSSGTEVEWNKTTTSTGYIDTAGAANNLWVISPVTTNNTGTLFVFGTDNTTPINTALATGKSVLLDKKSYLVTGQLAFAENSKLIGTDIPDILPGQLKGSSLLITNTINPALINKPGTVNSNESGFIGYNQVSQIIFYYPLQYNSLGTTPKVYPYTILFSGEDNIVEKNLFINSYNSIYMAYGGFGHSLISLNKIGGYATGINIDGIADITRIYDNHMWPFPAMFDGFTGLVNGYMDKWRETNGTCISIGRADGLILDNNFCFGYQNGIHFFVGVGDSNSIVSGPSYGQMGKFHCDQCIYGILADSGSTTSNGWQIQDLIIVGGAGIYGMIGVDAILANTAVYLYVNKIMTFGSFSDAPPYVNSNGGTVKILYNSTQGGVPANLVGSLPCVNCVGEKFSLSLSSASSVALTSGTTSNVLAVTMQPGDWLCFGVVDYIFGATTSYTNLSQGLSTTSVSLGAQDTYTDFETSATVPTAGNNMALVIPTQRFTFSVATNLYLVANATFSVSTLNVYGSFNCLRVQ